jgi:triosephosphate isomerase (TIM)
VTAFKTPFIAGNWKMHNGPLEARDFFGRFLSAYSASPDRTIVFFPPAISFAAAQGAVAGRPDVELGVQNIHWEEKGAFTGETSAKLARDAGAAYALVGHSERRALFGETNEDTARKTRAALAAGLTPILCVGETLEEREAGRAGEVVEGQLAAVLDGLEPDAAAKLVIAYEPVWAIGTGRTASPADAEELHARIRSVLVQRYGAEIGGATPILYGGSVKPDNAQGLLAAREVDGLLVGGASLDPEGFARVCAPTG